MPYRNRVRFTGWAALPLGLAAGLLVASTAAAQDCVKIHDIEITHEFTPKSLQIQEGDCVRWTNVHDIEHSAGGLNREFATGQLMPGGRALIRFDEAGAIPYWCQHHPPMQANLIVEKR